MTPNRVALRQGADGVFRELGPVVGRRGRAVLVKSGTEVQEVELDRGVLIPVYGGVQHLARVYPSVLSDIAQQNPRKLVHQVLHESTKALTAKALKDKLVEASLTPALVEAVWQAFRSTAEADDKVRVIGSGSGKRYEWRDERGDSVLREWLPLRSRAATVDTESTAGEEAADRGAEPGDPEQQRTSTQRTQAQAPLADVLGRMGVRLAGGTLWWQVVEQIRTREPSLRGLLDEVVPEDRWLIEVLLDASKASGQASSKVSRNRSVNDVPTVRVSIHACLEFLVELVEQYSSGPTANRNAKRRNTKALISEISRRFLNAHGLTADHLVSALLALRPLPKQFNSEVEKVADELVDLLSSSLHGHPDFDFDRTYYLAEVFRRFDLAKKSTRARFLVRLYKTTPEAVYNSAWWQGVSFDELVASEPTIFPVLADDYVGEHYVRPSVLRAAEETNTRARLGQLVGAPPELVRHIDGPTMASCWSRVADNDSPTRGWLAQLKNTAALNEATEQRGQAERALVEAEESARLAIARAREQSRENEELRERLRESRASQIERTAAQDRQVKIDVLRALADLALAVLRLPAARVDAVLLERLEVITRRQGLTPIGEVGAVVAYDPKLHEPDSAHVRPGKHVNIHVPGYCLTTGSESVVLVKAQVGTDG